MYEFRKNQVIFINARVSFIVTGNIKYSQNRSLRVKWQQDVRLAEEVQTLSERAKVLRYTSIVYVLIMRKMLIFMSKVYSCTILFKFNNYITSLQTNYL